MREVILWALLSLNMTIFIWFCVLFYRWIKNTNAYVSRVDDYCEYVIERTRCLYINQLHEIRLRLIKEERYEEAYKVTRIINKETELLEDSDTAENINV